MDPMEMQLFTNWTEEDFTGVWDKKPTTVKAGETLQMPAYLARFLAKHLADRECNKQGLPTDGVKKDEFMQKCMSSLAIVEDKFTAMPEVVSKVEVTDSAKPTKSIHWKTAEKLKKEAEQNINPAFKE